MKQQLDECMLTEKPTPQQLQELQHLIQRCRIKVSESDVALEPPSLSKINADNSASRPTGAIRKNVRDDVRRNASEKLSLELPDTMDRASMSQPPPVVLTTKTVSLPPSTNQQVEKSTAWNFVPATTFSEKTPIAKTDFMANLGLSMADSVSIAQQNTESYGNRPPLHCETAVGGTSHQFRNDVPQLFAQGQNPAPLLQRASHEQLIARQVMPRDLPEFSGDPEDWPIFLSSFNHSTLACGYSHIENLSRLQRSLKGNALKAVRFYLLSPESVPDVIKTLQTLYGHPEVIINKLIRNVRECPTPKAEKLETLLEFGITVRNLTQHLLATQHHAHLMNPILLQEVVEKLPASVKLQWAQYIQIIPAVSLSTFSDFMTSVMESISKVCSYVGSQPKPKEKSNVFSHVEVSQDNHVGREPVESKPGKKCSLCAEDRHRLKDCKSFKDSTVENRWKIVHNFKLCRTCLNFHGRRPCRSSARCGIGECLFRHHPLLHTEAKSSPEQVNNVNLSYHHCGQSVLFRIIPITIHGSTKSVNTFALLDEGSSTTLIESELAALLEVEGPIMPLCLKWTANMARSEDESQIISIEVSERGKRIRYRLENARTVRSLNFSPQTLRFGELEEKFRHLVGLPVQSYEAAVPRLMIGLRNLSLAVPQKVREGENGPIAVKTRLGWCVYGCFAPKQTSEQINYHLCDCNVEVKLDNLLKDYFCMEDIGGVSKVLESKEETRAKDILKRTTQKIGDRYQTGLLWRYDCIELPDNYPMALRRLECLERRMNRDEKLKATVHRQIKEYQDKGYAHPATEDELTSADPKRIWYLPLGVVTNPKKPEKVRLVWDAAAVTNGISLNSVLIAGPDLLTPLPFVLFRFRLMPFAVTSDITEMFHQIEIIPNDRNSQRFLFRNQPTEAPTIFLMDVATFGATCSPTIAQYIKNENAKKYKTHYPRAVEGILKGHYVDDYLDSFATMDEAKKVASEVRYVHSKAGFALHNWSSNSKDILDHLNESPQSVVKDLTLAKSVYTERVLGMQWYSEIDVLSFSLMFSTEIEAIVESNTRPTKRQMLKCMMSIFDPLGLLASFLIHGKVLMQEVWRSGISWDEPVSEKIFEQWQKWIAMFDQLKRIRIQRCYFEGANIEMYRFLQVHVFVDASETAYAAAVYYRTMKPDGTPQCTLVTAKAKVAPLKYHSIPRLELMAAVLGTRLLSLF
ncbi:uncharacterized protein LOC134211695 [Armigeres subalbatus]|uniref:uncharacterized protein LOC134211695 n=1 Tax=Armigeres subalbatus TaxID=124917 RepID=UPI002ED335E9